MNEEDEKLKNQADEYARLHKKSIAKLITDTSKYTPDTEPISIFMAGSPGAGKTEFSKNLITILERGSGRKIVRIDGDELRTQLPGYTGNNSHIFQNAISIVVDKIHDFVLSNKQTFLLDGTFSRYEKAVENIQRSLNKNRRVFIFYVYQRPDVAWKFTQSREVVEGRNIPKDSFIKHFLGSESTIKAIHTEFSNKVTIFIVKKNFNTLAVEEVAEIDSEENKIENYLEILYTEEKLNELLC